MATKIWNTAKQECLTRMYESGLYSTKEMAKELGVTQRTIYNRFLIEGWQTGQLPRRFKGHGKVEFTDEQDRKIVADNQEGIFTTQTARELGKPRTAVLRRIRELGLKNSNLLPLPVGRVPNSSLVVIGPSEPGRHPKTGFRVARSLVHCDCGKVLTLPNHAVRCGNTKSCGGSPHRLKPWTPWNRFAHSVRNGARQRGVSLSLSDEQIKMVALMPCVYCKRAESIGTTRARHNGLDQLVPSGGYHPGNVVPCCCICNRAKSNLSLNDFLAWLRNFGVDITEEKILKQASELGVQLAVFG